MKSTLITLVLIAAMGTAKGQTKHLAKVNIIKLSDREVLRLDSALTATYGSIDSKGLTNYLQRAVLPIYQQIQGQMIADTVKKAGDKKGG